MNHFHRVIFNRSLGVRQVVSEIASSGGGTVSVGTGLSQVPRLCALAAACLLAWCAAPQALAASCAALTSADFAACVSGAGTGDVMNLNADMTLSTDLGMFDKNLVIQGYNHTITISADNNLGGPSGLFKLTVGTLRNTSALVSARSFEFDAGGGTFQTDATMVVLGTVGGAGSLTKTGPSTLVLTQDSTYGAFTTTGTIISSGTLYIGNGGTSGSLGSGEVLNNAALVFHRSDTFTTGNDIRGTGTLQKAGTGTLILTGTNTYSGGTTISAGKISVAADAKLGAVSGALTFDGGTLQVTGTAYTATGRTINWGAGGGGFDIVDGSATFGVSQALTGTGGLVKEGAGTLVLTGANTYAGGTTIAAGTLQLRGNGSTGSTTGNVLNNGILDFNRSGGLLTLSGDISGNGSVRQTGLGTVTLSGDNTYTGGTTFFDGVLSVSRNANLGNATGKLFFDAGTLQTTGDFAMNRDTTLLTGGTISTDAGTTLTHQGAIDGAGGLVKTGAGTLALTNTGNTYTGGTLIGGGTLSISADENLGARDLLTLDGGTLRTTGAFTTARTISLRSNATIQTDADLTATGSIAGKPGAGLTKTGAGILTLTGNNRYTGGTRINAGVVSVASNVNLGNATGSLAFNGGALQTTADLTMNRALTLGTLGGTIDTAANKTLTQQGTTSNAIGEVGSLTKTGAGTLILSGNNSYTGVTTISAGTLQIGNGGATGSLGTGAVTNNAALVFNRSDAITAANAISGTGTLDKQGTGNLILSGANTYSGTTTISAGTLQIGNGGATGTLGSGAVTNNAALVFNRSDAITAANPISGTGTLDKQGTGNLILSGTNTYTGATTVNAGTLSVNGSIISATTVNNGGTLGGNGTVGNVTIASGGTLAPGNSIGTLTVNGTLTFAPGSVYRVETDAAGNADRVNVMGTPGTVTINGGTVDVQAGAGNYARNTRYTILTSTGATTGTFTGVTSNLAFLTPSLSYLPNGVTLNLLAENAPVYNTVAQTPNQASVANYLSSFANTPGSSSAAALIQQIDNLSAGQARVAFDSMSGSPHSAASQIAGAIGRNFSATLATRTGFGLGSAGNTAGSTAGLKAIKFASVSPALLTRSGDVVSDSPLVALAADAPGAASGFDAQSVGGLWGQAMGTGGRTGSDGNGPASRYRANDFVFGYDQPITSKWLAGAALAYTRTQWDASTNAAAPASGRISSPQAGLYARYTDGPWQVRLDGTYSDHRFSTNRTVTIGNASSIASSSHNGTEWAFAAQAEYSLPSGDWDIRPLAGLRHARLSEDGFTETGAGAASLTVDARRTQNTVASLGMKFIRPLNQSNTDKGSLELRAIASHLMGDNDSPLSSRLAGQASSFTAAGTPLKRTALTFGGTLTGQLSRGLSAYADAAYEYRGAGQNAFQFVAGLKLSW